MTREEFWDSLTNSTLEAEWMYEEYDEVHNQKFYTVDVSTSNEFTYFTMWAYEESNRLKDGLKIIGMTVVIGND